MRSTKTIHVSVLSQRRSHDDVVVHRRIALNTTKRHGIPVTTPAQTLIDIAKRHAVRARARVPQARRERGLPLPESQRRVGAYRVDFYWPAIGLVVETDGGPLPRDGEPAETTVLLVDVFTACECRLASGSTTLAD